MKKVTIILWTLFIVISCLSIEAFSLDTLDKVTIQEFNGMNAIFTNTNEMNEIANLLKDAKIKESSEQDITIKPDLYVIQEYKDKKTITIGISKESAYVKCDIEGDVYWYKLTSNNNEEIYATLKDKLQKNIEANK